MDHILITGGLGYIGSHTIERLLQEDKKIICIDNCINSNINILYKLKKITKKNFIFKNISIHDASLSSIFRDYKIDTIIHFASLKSVSESVKRPALYYYNNVLGSLNLLQNAKKYNTKNIIFSSSATVYGDPIFLPISESHPIRAKNPYAQNKIDIENIFFKDLYFHTKCSVKILRYFNPIGSHPSGMLGDIPNGIPNNIMPYLVNVAMKKYPYVNIFGADYNTNDGTGIRDYIHIMDLVEGHFLALDFKKVGISVFNLGTGNGYSVLELINTFQKVNNIKIPYKFSKRRNGDVASAFAKPDKAKKYLNFTAKRNLDIMCYDAWNFALNGFNN